MNRGAIQLLNKVSSGDLTVIQRTLTAAAAASASAAASPKKDLAVSKETATYLRQWALPQSSEAIFTKYGGYYTVTAIPGDGLGPEMFRYVERLYQSARVPVNFETISVTYDTPEAVEQAIMAVRRTGVALKGNIHTPVDAPVNQQSLNVKIRTELDLFAHIIRCRSLPGVKTRHNNVDMVIIRENTEGEYSNLEHEATSGIVEMLKVITRTRSERIARFAFEFAKQHDRKRVTVVHKANIMKLSDGLFLQCCREVSRDYPDIEFDAMIVDNCCMQLVSRPEQFDVLVMPNLYGNIVSNVVCGLVGGSWIIPGANLGTKYAVFETGTRRRGRSLVGMNKANPTAFLLASADVLDRLPGLAPKAAIVRAAVLEILAKKEFHTPDLNGTATTVEVVDAICNRVADLALEVEGHSDDA